MPQRIPRARGEDQRELTLVELWQELAAPVTGLARGALAAEFHGQLIRGLAILVLPLLALPLALGQPGKRRRSYGISGLQLGRRLIPAGLFLAGIQYGLDDVARPPAIEELRAWQVDEPEARYPGMPAGGGVWLRSGDDIVRLSGGPGPAGEFADLVVLRRDPTGLLLERLEARAARPQAEGWLLRDVIR